MVTLDGNLNILPMTTVKENLMLGAAPWVTEGDAEFLTETMSPPPFAMDFDAIDPHMTDREQLVVQIVRALLCDPDVLMINLKHLPLDEWSEHLYLVLWLWRRAGGLKELLRELRWMGEKDKDDVVELMVARIHDLGEASALPEPTKARTLVVVPPSLWWLLESTHLRCGLDNVIHLSGPGECVVDTVEVAEARRTCLRLPKPAGSSEILQPAADPPKLPDFAGVVPS